MEAGRPTAHLPECILRLDTQGLSVKYLFPFRVGEAFFSQDPEGMSLDTSHPLLGVCELTNL